MQNRRYAIPEKISSSASCWAVPVLERFIAPQENPTAPPSRMMETPTIASNPKLAAINTPREAKGMKVLRLIGTQSRQKMVISAAITRDSLPFVRLLREPAAA